MIDRRSLLGLMATLPFLPHPARAAAPQVIATTGMIADAARRLTGLAVPSILGPGMDPHSHRPTRGDVLALSRADIILWHGLNLEAQFREVIGELAQKKTVVALGEALPKELLLSDPAYPDQPDPHVWMDPAIWQQVVAEAGRALAAAGYDTATRGEEFAAEIAALGTYSAEVLASVPEEARVLVTAHDAFGYFARAYGLTFIAPQGVSTETEASSRDVARIIRQIRAEKIPAVFLENISDPRLMNQIARETGARIGEALFPDSLSAADGPAATYAAMMRRNLEAFTKALR